MSLKNNLNSNNQRGHSEMIIKPKPKQQGKIDQTKLTANFNNNKSQERSVINNLRIKQINKSPDNQYSFSIQQRERANTYYQQIQQQKQINYIDSIEILEEETNRCPQKQDQSQITQKNRNYGQYQQTNNKLVSKIQQRNYYQKPEQTQCQNHAQEQIKNSEQSANNKIQINMKRNESVIMIIQPFCSICKQIYKKEENQYICNQCNGVFHLSCFFNALIQLIQKQGTLSCQGLINGKRCTKKLHMGQLLNIIQQQNKDLQQQNKDILLNQFKKLVIDSQLEQISKNYKLKKCCNKSCSMLIYLDLSKKTIGYCIGCGKIQCYKCSKVLQNYLVQHKC